MTSFAATSSRRDATSRRDTGSESRSRVSGNRDLVLLGTVGLLVGLGLVLVYSSSSVFAAKRYGDAEHFLRLQATYLCVGLVCAFVAAKQSSEQLAKRAALIFFGVTFLCMIVLIPGIGKFVGGARRWLSFGFVGFQPSVLAKLAVVIVLAHVLARRDKRADKERPSLLVPVLLVQLPVAFILLEPDLGTALVIELLTCMMVFAAGLRPRTFVFLGLAAMPVLYHLIVGTEFRLRRLLSYIDPWAYRQTVGYQITESLISIGSGGVTGVGLGGGKHKLFFLPEAHTDFIFAILAEELGLIGVVLVLVAFALFIGRGLQVALRARSPFDSYLAVGLTGIIGIPAVFNACVATGLLPTKGLPLPLISYGGSDLIVNLCAIGMLLRIASTQGSGEKSA